MIQQLKTYRSALLCLTVASGCSSTATITSVPPSDIMELSPDYSIEANVGKGPIPVDSQSNLERYQFFRAGQPEEFLLLLFPEMLDGDLQVALADGSTATVTSVYGTYFDLLLRAHRMLLSGDLNGAESTISRIEANYDEGYGTAVLKANLAVVRGDVDEAARHFEIANRLLPGNEALSNLVPKDGSAGGTNN